jgi:hypothetical protein
VIWLSWRQQRIETVMGAALLVLAAVSLVPAGLHMASVYDSSGASACVARTATSGAGCGGIVNDFLHQFEHAGSIIPWLNFLPGLFGVLFAAPLVLELEQGTFRLSWTQSITRRRWLTLKLVAIYASGLLAAAGLSLLLTWWRQPLDSLQGRMEPNVFDFEGIVPYAYTLCAISIVLAIGVFTRRTLVATAGGLLGYFGLRISIQMWLREHYRAPVRVVWRPGSEGPTNLDRAWQIISGPSDAHGHPLPIKAAARCLGSPASPAAKGGIESCLDAHHIYNIAVYQPASRFWLFQGIEASIFIGLAAALLLGAIWWLRHRIG